MSETRTGTQPLRAASYRGYRRSACPPAWSSSMAVLMAPALPRSRRGRRCPIRAAWPDPWPGGGGDTMNALAANDFQAADLPALARLDDGAPGRWSRCSAMPSCTACWTTTAARSRQPNHPGCPVSRSTARSTSTRSSPGQANRPCDPVPAQPHTGIMAPSPARNLPPEPAAASPATIQAPGPRPGTRRRAAQPGNR